MSCPHTTEVLCNVLMDTFLEWNIDRKLSTLTVDNCSTNDAMISLLLEKFKNDVHLWTKNLKLCKSQCKCLPHTDNWDLTNKYVGDFKYFTKSPSCLARLSIQLQTYFFPRCVRLNLRYLNKSSVRMIW